MHFPLNCMACCCKLEQWVREYLWTISRYVHGRHLKGFAKNTRSMNIAHITALSGVFEPGTPGLLLPNQRFVALRNDLLTPFLLEI
jgi:hypothetical protein